MLPILTAPLPTTPRGDYPGARGWFDAATGADSAGATSMSPGHAEEYAGSPSRSRRMPSLYRAISRRASQHVLGDEPSASRPSLSRRLSVRSPMHRDNDLSAFQAAANARNVPRPSLQQDLSTNMGRGAVPGPARPRPPKPQRAASTPQPLSRTEDTEAGTQPRVSTPSRFAPLIDLGPTSEPPPPVPPLPSSPVTSRPMSPTTKASMLSANVVLHCEPSTRQVTMFGPLQITGSYSLSGVVRLSLPHAMGSCTKLQLTSLQVRITGYSMYIDSSGRFSALRMCELTDAPITSPLSISLPPHGARTQEAEFDVHIPGWLPASISTRTVSTFYALDVEAQLHDVPAAGSTLLPDLAETPPSVCVRSTPMLVTVLRTRDLVPIPVAQAAVFNGPDVPLSGMPDMSGWHSTNPFRRALDSEAGSAPSTPVVADTPAASVQAAPTVAKPKTVPPRHYSHMARLHLPTPVMIDKNMYEFLPVKVTLTVPGHAPTHTNSTEDQAPLVFSVAVELDKMWQQAKHWRDVRLCELEAVCIQMEKYSSVLSRSYCTAFALPTSGEALLEARRVPQFDNVPRAMGVVTPHSAGGVPGLPPHPYHRVMMENRLRQEQGAQAPQDQANNVERFRAYTVGPVPESAKDAAARSGATSPTPSARDDPRSRDDKAHSASTSQTRRRRVTTAFSKLGALAGRRDNTAESVAESAASSSNVLPSQVLGHGGGAAASASGRSTGNEPIKASYSFDGPDGMGLALAQKRVRLSFSLPLVPSSGRAASKQMVPQLLPDYESPHMRIRHKLKIKLRFNFGSSPLGPTAALQSVVMSVPLRFSEAPPACALSQAPPLVLPSKAQMFVPGEHDRGEAVPLAYAQASRASVSALDHQRYLPAYTQLFREDGSRLEEEDWALPPYPDQVAQPAAVDTVMAERLAAQLRLASHEERETKTAAPISVLEALSEEDEAMFERAAAVDDDMMFDEVERLGQEDDAYADDELAASAEARQDAAAALRPRGVAMTSAASRESPLLSPPADARGSPLTASLTSDARESPLPAMTLSTYSGTPGESTSAPAPAPAFAWSGSALASRATTPSSLWQSAAPVARPSESGAMPPAPSDAPPAAPAAALTASALPAYLQSSMPSYLLSPLAVERSEYMDGQPHS